MRFATSVQGVVEIFIGGLGGCAETHLSFVQNWRRVMRNVPKPGRARRVAESVWAEVEASVAAGGVGEAGGTGRLFLRPFGLEEIKDTANRPIP